MVFLKKINFKTTMVYSVYKVDFERVTEIQTTGTRKFA